MSKGKKDQEVPAPRLKCDAEGWCWTMERAIEATGHGRKGLRVAQLASTTITYEAAVQAVVYDFGMAGWSGLRCCPFCEGNPNARYAPAKQAGEVTP